MKQEADCRAQLEQLSLEEKATLLTGANFWNTAKVPGVNEILLSDGPSGIRKQTEGGDALGLTGSVETIAFPCLALIASTFDKDLLRKYGEYLGQIAKSEKVNVLLGPGMNIKRSPLAGRNFEYFSEDPFLTAELAIQYIKGVESQGIGTSPKHFAANNRENERFTSSSNIQSRPLHEIYLSAFKRVVEEAQPATIMNSYNKVNHVLVAENQYLLTDLLRSQWNYDGLVVSDWGAVKDRVKSLRAGLDLEMPGQPDYSIPQVVEAVRSGKLDVLSGKVNPSGKLAETFPECIQDTPSYLTFNRSTEEENYMEGIFVGYRYYATKDMPVAFPFGHGLSYTDFEYSDSNVKVDNDKDQIEIDVTVKNTGEVQGAEVVQVYLQNRASNIEMSAKELKAFERVELEADKSKTVKLVIPFERLKWFNPQTSLWQIDNGNYTVHIGSSVNDIHSHHDFEITSIDESPIQLSLDSSLKDIIDLQDTLSHEIDEFGFDQMIHKMTSEPNLRVLAEPAPIRMLVMFGLKLSDLVKFVEKCNVRLKTGE
ncbi:family 3 glycosyl hydrolase [Staphylococcus condimenti]|uniref:Fibronectin type III-like domain-contianing protein n=1 Tax=Staphylococcus condimenti TaxID=70255 RepID=A0AB37HAK6_9STAP|nr:glycoside hydrolase family 3 N-terminal domain-containing protein [Staphylococcus condimenti]AMY05956.1 hypothetical protein A4G25_08460 [Staphylococcus condimenti]PNZ60582.1 family 3 glycosyl hydrolase [Staphylococcus condimenti]QQS82246.1 fibronectin type III-like domain-contianing protein [Staphylococcus condimenti]QRP95392.1 fibronectin type III-like domain-contianing protein [Staphylococcus condimenti]VEG63099.1 putative glucosidase [Staphylococcus condimenti]